MLPHSRYTLTVAVGGLCVLLLLVVAGTLLRRRMPPPPPLPVVAAPALAPASNAPPPSAVPPVTPVPARAPIVVHVVGCVRKPGVYSFAEGARVCDAVQRAGGAKPQADLEAVNLAARLEDGKQLYVPRKQPATPAQTARRTPAPPARATTFWTPPAAVKLEPIPPGRMPLARPAAGSPAPPAEEPGEEARPEKIRSPEEGRVNINRADAAELQRLPGVGVVTAQAILEYRAQHGPFQSVEQLLEVRGIGEKRLAKLRDLVDL